MTCCWFGPRGRKCKESATVTIAWENTGGRLPIKSEHPYCTRHAVAARHLVAGQDGNRVLRMRWL